jgi:hypothetical protein
MWRLFLLFFCLCLVSSVNASEHNRDKTSRKKADTATVHALSKKDNAATIAQLTDAVVNIERVIAGIGAEYMVDVLPQAFLGSFAMPENSWELLVNRFYSRIFHGLANGKTDDFVITFLGSSVTAGHDNQFNTSTTEVLRDLMAPVVKAAGLGFDIVVRNAAIGGIACFPYDVCPNTMAGFDVDILQWEQTYFCFSEKLEFAAEGLIRAALESPGAPIVVFSDSSTGPYNEADCAKVDTKDWQTKHLESGVYKDKSIKEIATVG